MQHINRSKSVKTKLYLYFKDKDLSELTDEEFALLRKKMNTYYTFTPTTPASSALSGPLNYIFAETIDLSSCLDI